MSLDKMEFSKSKRDKAQEIEFEKEENLDPIDTLFEKVFEMKRMKKKNNIMK